ncbi:hypothetical protein [Halovenus salina]|uniref:Restriction endonuclease n=1 Tax=Halovenus salina TaxID=1510225 RepID=A0ABD5W2Z6_9EURY|nr:hypothetical protein [Halovenus salina]
MGSVEQAELMDYNAKPSAERDEGDPLTGALESAFKESSLSDYLGYNICDVDFVPVEQAIRPTCRLVVGRNPDLYPLKRKRPHPVSELITDLNNDDIPYIFQTIVSIGNNADYELSQRLAIYPPEYGIGVEDDFVQFIEEGPDKDLSDYYDPAIGKIRSNFDLDGHDFFRIIGSGPDATVEPRQDRGEAVAQRARRVLQGTYECHKLYAGYHDTDQTLETLYRYRDFYTKIPVDSAVLDAFVAFVPYYVDYTPWDRIRYADQPSLIRRPKELPPKNTSSEQSGGASAASETASDSGNIFATQGNEPHRFDEDTVAEYYEHRGFDVSRPDTKSSGSVPDLILQKDDDTYFAEVERSGTSRPANILTNAARAAYYDVPVYFFTEDRSKARTVAKLLRDPVKKHTETGAQLYTQSRALTLENGGRPVLPQTAASESRWFLVNDDSDPSTSAQLELRVEGRQEPIADGPADESVASWNYDTDVIPSGRSVPEEQTQIHPPFVPTKLAYLKETTIRYRLDMNEFTHFERDDYKPGWDYPDEEGKRKRYKAAFGTFLKNKTITVEEADLHKDDVISACLNEVYKPQTNRKAPGTGESGEAGRALWEHADKKEITSDDVAGRIKKVKNRTWRWPRDIESPDLPFKNDEPALEQWL